MKICSLCFTEREDTEYYKNGIRFRPECKSCTDVKQRASRYGITIEKLISMYREQDFKCAICRRECKSYRNLSIDHDHKCCPEDGKSCGKCVRGLLCSNCNHGIGKFDENLEVMQSAIMYLRSHRSSNLRISTAE